MEAGVLLVTPQRPTGSTQPGARLGYESGAYANGGEDEQHGGHEGGSQDGARSEQREVKAPALVLASDTLAHDFNQPPCAVHLAQQKVAIMSATSPTRT